MLWRIVELTLIAAITGAAGIAQASSITFSGLEFTAPVFSFGANDVFVSPTNVSGYSYSAEFCVVGDCSFALSGNPTTSSVELANLSLSCQSESTCSPLDVTFQSGFDVAPGSNESIQVSLGNTTFGGSAFTGLARICFSDATHICASDLTGTSSFGFLFSSGSFSGGSLGSYQPGPTGPFQLLGLLQIDGLSPGGSINIGQSLDITTQQAAGSGSGVIEPATLLMLPIGLVALSALAIFRQKNRRSGAMSHHRSEGTQIC